MKIQPAILFILIMTVAGISYFIWFADNGHKRAGETQRWINLTNDIIRHSDEVLSGMAETESATRGFVISAEELFVKDIEITHNNVENNINKVRSLTADNRLQQTRIKLLTGLCQDKMALQLEIIRARREQPELSFKIISSLKGKRLMDSVKEVITTIKDTETGALTQRIAANNEASQKVMKTMIWGSIIILVFILVILLRMNRNIRLRQQVEKSREETQHRLESILNNTPLHIYTKDLQGIFRMVNKAFCADMQVNEKDMIGKSDFDILPLEQAEKLSAANEEVMHTRRNHELEIVIATGKGFRNVHVVQFPLLDKRNIIYGIGGIATDITEKILQQQQLIDAKKDAESAVEMQEQFLTNMSHEIRTPMNGITGMSNLLAQTSLTMEQREYVDLILQSSNSLQVLINNILELSRIKAGELIIENKPFDIREAIGQVTQLWRIRANKKGLDFKVSIQPDVPMFLIGDSYRLCQVLNNLLSNSVKFTHEGYVSLTVGALIKDGSSSLVADVTDTGIGIPIHKMEYIFENFTQADNGNIREIEGAGLGLPIAKMLVQLQLGTIEVKSQPNIHTTFTVTIPCQEASTTPEATIAKMQQSTDTPLFINKRILVAEDNAINQKVICLQLSRFGIMPQLASTGKEVITQMERDPDFDLIIMDLRMPEMNGFQTALYIRNQLKSSVPIIAITASVLHNEHIKCMEVGMNGFLAKPFSPGALADILQKFLTSTATPTVEAIPIKIGDPPGKLYDLSELIDLDEPGFVAEVLQGFITSLPLALKDIRLETIKGRWAEVYDKAHHLKTSAGLLQISSLFNSLSDIEQMSGEKAGTKIIGIVDLLENWFRMLRPILELEIEKNLLQTK